ncbi:hypothetical protein GCM10017687_53380 [Streptomyces echinatus]
MLREQAPWPRAAAALHTAGAVRLALGQLESAEALFAEVLHIAPLGSFHALYPVEGLALVAAESGDMQRALRLCEASAQARRRLDTEPEAPWRRRIEQAAARARTPLPTAAREAAVVGARKLRGDRLVAYALRTGSGEQVRRGPDTLGAGDERWRLTARELMVVELVAKGADQPADRGHTRAFGAYGRHNTWTGCATSWVFAHAHRSPCGSVEEIRRLRFPDIVQQTSRNSPNSVPTAKPSSASSPS